MKTALKCMPSLTAKCLGIHALSGYSTTFLHLSSSFWLRMCLFLSLLSFYFSLMTKIPNPRSQWMRINLAISRSTVMNLFHIWVHLNHLSDPNFIKFVIKYKRYTFQLERNVLGHFCMLGTLPIRMISHTAN